jgi:FtsP/CotA-like multicopper oxidase with cupredoxin domain
MNLSCLKKFRYLAVAILFLITVMAGTSLAAEYWLQAANLNKTMPDGQVIPMWGFGQCTDNFASCNPPMVPGPELVVPPGDNNLTVHLRNNLTGLFVEPVSIVIPGQFTTQVPVWIDPATGTVTGTGSRPALDVTSRVRSLTHETAPGATQDYVWNNVKTGTYLYESGTHQQIQIPMGLYGAMRKDAGAGQAYAPTVTNPNTSYDSQVTLLFSEIDPAINNAVATNNYGPGKAMTSTNDYRPKYFLINGEPFSPGRGAISPTPAANPTDAILIRFLSAGSLDHIPILHGSHMEILAEDGNLYPFSKQQYSLLLAPGKTFDAIMTPANTGYIRVYDRKLHLTNAAASPGGMLTYITVGAANQLLTVTKAGAGTGTVTTTSLPGGIDCGLDCTENFISGTMVGLKATANQGSTFAGWSVDATGTDPATTVTMNAAKNVTATFTGGGVGGAITLTSPNGGEVWQRNTTQTITWNFTGNPGTHVRIQAFKPTGLPVSVAFRTPIGANGSGSFNWRIPRFFGRTGNDIKLKITVTTNTTVTDSSDNFFTLNP